MEQKKQTKFIKGKREIGKILMCLIIAIIMLSSLKTIATTIIAGSADVIEDEKTIVRTAASVSRGASSSNKVELASLTAELGKYASTTVTQLSSEILQVKFNRTGNIYEINVNIGPTFDATGTIPYLPAGYTPVENTDLETGFVIEDENGNQFVWVEVPRTAEVYPTAGTNVTTFNDATYNNIEADLHTYTSVYRREGYADEYYSDAATGLTSSEYNAQKKKMLKSIYKCGGFYVGRYETGIDYSQSHRTGAGETTQTPVIKQNAYPYNLVTTAQAQTLSESFSTTGYSSSLMFGVQWDLVLKYLETRGITEAELKADSTEWGNYYNNTYNLTNTNAKYSLDYGNTWTSAPYNKTSTSDKVVVTTGASPEFSKQNISDFAGNVWEWTLEGHLTYNTVRGGDYALGTGSTYPAFGVSNTTVGTSNLRMGFRVSLYKDETDNTKTPTYIPEGYTHIAGDMDEGYVIADANGNQFVWVEVPRTTAVYPTAGVNITSFTSTAYEKIEADLHTYTSFYRKGTVAVDEYFSDDLTGLTQSQYNTQKKKMLKSIYKNGGFYVGRYETGIDYSEGPRTASGNTTQTPVIKQNAYPYSWVTTNQAQTLASNFATNGYISSLMFGVQWDLVLKYLETKGATQSELMTDSTHWGNYTNNLYRIINANAKYSTDDGVTWHQVPYYKTETSAVLLTTGASDTFSKQNIYDLAGSTWNATLEYSGKESAPHMGRGSAYWWTGEIYAGYRSGDVIDFQSNGMTGRVALYKDETDTTRTPTYIPEGYTHIAGNMDEGYVIADPSGNEYVWVEVPRNATVYDEVGTELDLDSLSGTALTTALDDIEEELQEYATDYRKSSFSDTWSSEAQHGFESADDYNDLKYTMLKSVYENGGFYIGRYETGTSTARTSASDALGTAVIKQNAYPYNYVTSAQAQTLASGMASGDYTSSLMFGIQWDLVMKYLEEKGVDQDLLLTDSSTLGNYTGVLLETGSDSTYSKMGIYDLAGNVSELTLEYTSNTDKPCATRGGHYFNYGNYSPASVRDYDSTTNSHSTDGFRVSLY